MAADTLRFPTMASVTLVTAPRRFATLGGELTAKRAGPGVEMALPRHLGLPPADGRWAGLAEVAACGLPVLEVLHTPALAYLTVVLGDAVTRQQLEAVSPDMEALVVAGTLAGVTVTCRGDSTHHFYSRWCWWWSGWGRWWWRWFCSPLQPPAGTLTPGRESRRTL